MKKCLPIVIVTIIAMICGIVCFFACTSEKSYSDCLIYEAIEENSEIIAYRVTGSSDRKIIEIPSEYDGKPVTEIGDNAFEEGAFLFVRLKKITIPESVKKIGSDAFWGCIDLSDIIFNGTKTQWEAIEKGDNWYSGSQSDFLIIRCTDGNIICEPVYD